MWMVLLLLLLLLLAVLPLLLVDLAVAFGAQPVPLGVPVEATLVATLELGLADAQAWCFIGLHSVGRFDNVC